MTGNTFFSIEKSPDGRSGGSTQAETRVYNERLVISLIRRHGQLSKVDLTRLTGLAPQTITTIVNRAADNELLLRRDPLRGRLGQPSVPYALNPKGAYSFGLKIDHRSADVALVDFVGEVIAFERSTFDYPMPNGIMTFAKSSMARMCRKHKSISLDRIAGLGIASPFHQRSWNEDFGVPTSRLDPWKQIDIRAELDSLFEWPVYLFNDAMVSAGAELMFGSGLRCADFLYAYIGDHLGGGLVIDRHLFPGRNKLAGAIGDIAVPRHTRRTELATQDTSLRYLASKLDARDSQRIWSPQESWDVLGGPLIEWIDEVSEALAHVTRSAVALLDIDNLIVDGAIPGHVRKEIAKATRRKLVHPLHDRPEPFTVIEGAFGHLAPVIGGASIPLMVKYSNDKEALFKD